MSRSVEDGTSPSINEISSDFLTTDSESDHLYPPPLGGRRYSRNFEDEDAPLLAESLSPNDPFTRSYSFKEPESPSTSAAPNPRIGANPLSERSKARYSRIREPTSSRIVRDNVTFSPSTNHLASSVSSVTAESQYADSPILSRLDDYFQISALGSNFTTEILGGVVSFLVSLYILQVEPTTLSDAGMDYNSVFFATALVSGLGTIFMGLFAKVPILIAPGMGFNTYFAKVLVTQLGQSWETALGYTFCQGLLLLVVVFFSVRGAVLLALPDSLRIGVGLGIAMFLATLGFENINLYYEAHNKLDLSYQTVIGMVTLVAIILMDRWLEKRKHNRAWAYIISIMLATVVSVSANLIHHKADPAAAFPNYPSWKLRSPGSTVFALRFDKFRWATLYIVPVMAMTHLLDCGSTVLSLLQQAYLVGYGTLPTLSTISQIRNVKGESTTMQYATSNFYSPLQTMASSTRTRRALLVDAGASVVGALLGTSTTTCYLESAIGIHVGARSGVASLVAGSLFLLSILVYPLVYIIPSDATGPALIITAFNLFPMIKYLNLDDLSESAPTLFAALFIPWSRSIANGAALAYLVLFGIKITTGPFNKLWLKTTVTMSAFAVVALMVVTSDFVFSKITNEQEH